MNIRSGRPKRWVVIVTVIAVVFICGLIAVGPAYAPVKYGTVALIARFEGLTAVPRTHPVGIHPQPAERRVGHSTRHRHHTVDTRAPFGRPGRVARVALRHVRNHSTLTMTRASRHNPSRS